MKYLTKEWYELCQQTDLHFDMSVHNGAKGYDEALYLRLYKRKENEFVNMQREIYGVDPRFMLEQDDCTLVSFEQFVGGEEITEEDQMVYHMQTEEKEHIEKLIKEYDERPPFDEKKCREEFSAVQGMLKKETVARLPRELYEEIADVRVFSLGYCTKEILKQLKGLSKENEKEMNRILDVYVQAQQEENLPPIIGERFGFHDCEVTAFIVGEKDIVMHLDTSGGFTDFNTITFAAPEILKQEGSIVGSTWLYEELYQTENGYEAHILFAGEGMPELIICCNDIIVEEK